MDRTRRDELEIASALLHKIADGAEITAGDSLKAVVAAAAVDAVMEPGGWTQLREAEGVYTTNLPITTRASVRDALKKAAKAKRKSLTALVTEGHREVLAGTWTPPQSRRVVRRGESAAKDARVVLNVTVEDALRQELRKRLASLSDELGYTVTEGGIALAYLKHKLGIVDEALAARGWWTADQCAEYRGIGRDQWLRNVEAGVEPPHGEVTAAGVQLWDAGAVRGE
ncbi:hypothetical protein [Streptomyces collinus]|uniref:hypothetical protein n=1 Tax=Streptomyces collinus TaxID=42684 RepID=UPI00382CB1BF